jgi:ring-1,2-phenylacetyl-CoA epoxidase subunit PaaC
VTSVERLLCLGDDALIMAQRLSWWCSRAPEMEEDVALANIALDQLGVARQLLGYAGELTGTDEDGLAYRRDAAEFRNCILVELPEFDFAFTIAKLLFVSAYQHPLYQQLTTAGDQRLAGVAAKAVKESAYHLDHAILWTLRLGDGTAESHRRMQSAIDALWPYTDELFEPAAQAVRPVWLATVLPALDQATLRRPPEAAPVDDAPPEAAPVDDAPPEAAPVDDAPPEAAPVDDAPPEAAPLNAAPPNAGPTDDLMVQGGRAGRHTPALTELLAEMQVVHRAHPGAIW